MTSTSAGSLPCLSALVGDVTILLSVTRRRWISDDSPDRVGEATAVTLSRAVVISASYTPA